MSFALTVIVLSPERMATRARSGSASVFQERVSEYTRLRQQIVRHLQADRLDGDGADDADAAIRRALASAIRAARYDARAGDVFGVEMSGRILRMVRADLSARAPRDRDAILFEVPAVADVRVNDGYPNGAPLATMPPLLLMQLVPLPPELQYRFLGDAIIMLDVDASLIVDVVPHALRLNLNKQSLLTAAGFDQDEAFMVVDSGEIRR
jgi:hypothetical protein